MSLQSILTSTVQREIGDCVGGDTLWLTEPIMFLYFITIMNSLILQIRTQLLISE